VKREVNNTKAFKQLNYDVENAV